MSVKICKCGWDPNTNSVHRCHRCKVGIGHIRFIDPSAAGRNEDTRQTVACNNCWQDYVNRTQRDSDEW